MRKTRCDGLGGSYTGSISDGPPAAACPTSPATRSGARRGGVEGDEAMVEGKALKQAAKRKEDGSLYKLVR